MLKPPYKLLLITLPFLISCSGKNLKSYTNDTVFLEKISEKDFGYKVFVERNRTSDIYSQLLNFDFDTSEKKNFKESFSYLKQRYPAPLKRYNLSNIPAEWLPVYSYKNHYYLYSPAETGNEGRCTITDSVIIFHGTEPMAQPILVASKTDDYTWLIKTDAYYQSPPGTETLLIHVINPKTMLSVWEEFSTLRGRNYQLYVPRQYANNFDVLVKQSDGRTKVPEFTFDNINLKALLKGK